MRLSFCFSGWVNDVNVKEVTETATGAMVPVEGMDPAVLAAKLESGEYLVSLGSAIDDANKADVQTFDFEAKA
jgi:hypothetical protein